MNTPFVLKPSGKDYLWGGRRLIDEWSKNLGVVPLAETWECSTSHDAPSFVASGELEGCSLARVLDDRPDFLGEKHENESAFLLLVKLIDAQRDFAVQVHPGDEYAREHESGEKSI